MFFGSLAIISGSAKNSERIETGRLAFGFHGRFLWSSLGGRAGAGWVGPRANVRRSTVVWRLSDLNYCFGIMLRSGFAGYADNGSNLKTIKGRSVNWFGRGERRETNRMEKMCVPRREEIRNAQFDLCPVACACRCCRWSSVGVGESRFGFRREAAQEVSRCGIFLLIFPSPRPTINR